MAVRALQHLKCGPLVPSALAAVAPPAPLRRTVAHAAALLHCRRARDGGATMLGRRRFASTVGAATRQLLGGWLAIHSQQHGRDYFWHKASGTVTWKAPVSAMPEPTALPPHSTAQAASQSTVQASLSPPSHSSMGSSASGGLLPDDEVLLRSAAVDESMSASQASSPTAGMADGTLMSTARLGRAADVGIGVAPSASGGEVGMPVHAGQALRSKEAQVVASGNQPQDGSLRARDLPDGWVAVHSAEHNREYYWHRPSGATTWERPALMPQLDSSGGAGNPAYAAEKNIFRGHKGWQDVRRKVSRILQQRPIGTELEAEEFAVVRGLLNYHPEAVAKIGVGVRAIKVDASLHESQSRCFWMRRTDGSMEDFSTRRCLQQLRISEGWARGPTSHHGRRQ
eukprot:NODE_7578_length_1566_cov_16.286310.p1 GENE.NODE_7578_length_1566_cov_16.286310~~NODE_7578_length_1566_cov_16.286310.p1  ORF type:complete len:421 (-),score=77.50 NODE_7578_length_1566_cov_16.286310:302-1495(-)